MNGQRRQFHSIPLRKQAVQAQTRTTTGSHTAIPAQQTRGKQPQTQAPKPQSFLSHRNMPAMPDEDDLYLPAHTHTSARRYIDTQGREVIERGSQRLIIEKRKPP